MSKVFALGALNASAPGTRASGACVAGEQATAASVPVGGASEECVPDDINISAFSVGAEPLSAFFARTPAFALALSGGADSACLLGAAAKAGCSVKAYMVKTAFQPDADVADAKRVAQEWGVPFQVIRANVLAQPNICANTEQRCYWCKKFIFGAILCQVHTDGFSLLCDGTNASDNPVRRPGFRALAELGVVSPLRRAGLAKQDVRELGERIGVSLANKPRFSCYAVHAPQGKPLTEEVIAGVAATFENL